MYPCKPLQILLHLHYYRKFLILIARVNFRRTDQVCEYRMYCIRDIHPVATMWVIKMTFHPSLTLGYVSQCLTWTDTLLTWSPRPPAPLVLTSATVWEERQESFHTCKCKSHPLLFYLVCNNATRWMPTEWFRDPCCIHGPERWYDELFTKFE